VQNKFLLKIVTFRAQRGFTLIELLVVIGIISILASLVESSLQSARIRARESQIKETVAEAGHYMDRYRLDDLADGNYISIGPSFSGQTFRGSNDYLFTTIFTGTESFTSGSATYGMKIYGVNNYIYSMCTFAPATSSYWQIDATSMVLQVPLTDGSHQIYKNGSVYTSGSATSCP